MTKEEIEERAYEWVSAKTERELIELILEVDARVGDIGFTESLIGALFRSVRQDLGESTAREVFEAAMSFD